MSKSAGNFFTLKEIVDKYGADATRIAMSDAGDSLSDANFVEKIAEEAILKITAMEMWFKKDLPNIKEMRETSENE